ncbi:hypothetical protein CJ030_MR6G021387 [Morella rubra]|uniref:DSBA-like thioredoxin domain-containing protein n=1 Tax=Morella rubra TaxID=262757 RepID=A0A6A1VFB3_9ROSI|nr:hypothetical protein CJ030_MR6G021387 [Morella rubra]
MSGPDSVGNSSEKKLIKIDVSSDTECPWCFVGKRNLDKALAVSKDQYNFEVRWHPFQLNPSAPKEGINKREYYRKKFGSQSESMEARMSQVFRSDGLEYNLSGLTGNTLDSHRLMYFAAQQGLDKQHDLMEELSLGYFTQGKYIGDRGRRMFRVCNFPTTAGLAVLGPILLLDNITLYNNNYSMDDTKRGLASYSGRGLCWEFLVESAKKVGIEGAAEFLQDPNNGLKEVNEELEKYSANISGVPYFVINGIQKLSGAQPSEVFLRAFQVTAN